MRTFRFIIDNIESREFEILNKLVGCEIYRNFYLRKSTEMVSHFNVVNRKIGSVDALVFINADSNLLISQPFRNRIQFLPALLSINLFDLYDPIDVSITAIKIKQDKELIYEGYKDSY